MNLKDLIKNSPLEKPARFLWRLANPSSRASTAATPVNFKASDWEVREVRDNAYIRVLLRQTLKWDSNCVDIGSHAGDFLDRFLEFAPHGKHLAFEPISSMAEALKVKYSNVAVHCCALSDSTGETTFQFVPEMPAWSGLRAQPYPGETRPQQIPVKIQRLDDIIPAEFPVAFIKIDVEGAELEVLRGACQTLRNKKPVVLFECGKIHHMHYATTPQKVYEFLDSVGMGVHLLDQEGPLSLERFEEVYESSFASGYDRNAHGNYLAIPIS